MRLIDVLERTRRDIIESLELRAKSWINLYPSLGPALLFLEESNSGCIHNWSQVEWEELKLGHSMLRALKAARDLLEEMEDELLAKVDLNVFEYSQLKGTVEDFEKNIGTIKKYKTFKDDEEKCLAVVQEIKSLFKDFLNLFVMDFSRTFDLASEETSPGDENIIININQIVDKLKRVFDPQKLRITNLSDHYFEKYHQIDKIIKKLLEINQNRREAFIELIEKLCSKKDNPEDLKRVEEYIAKHPHYYDYVEENGDFDKKRKSKSKDEARNRWKNFAQKITDKYCKECHQNEDEECNKDKGCNLPDDALSKTDCKLPDIIINIFRDLPQERLSSEGFTRLVQKNEEAFRQSCDFYNISLRDLIFIPYDPKEGKPMHTYVHHEMEKYKLYFSTTHWFETVFYGSEIPSRSTIDNIMFAPIKFFDFQVKGQMVIITPDKLDKEACIKAIEANYYDIKEAAKLDFYYEIVRLSYYTGTKIPFSVVLGKCLPRLFSLEGLVIWDNTITVVGKKENTFEDTHAELKFFERNDIDKCLDAQHKNKIEQFFSQNNSSGISCQIFDLNERTELKVIDNPEQFEPHSCAVLWLPLSKSNGENSENLRPLKDGDGIGVMLFFRESADITMISREDIQKTISYALVFEQALGEAKKFRTLDTLIKTVRHDEYHLLGSLKERTDRLLENLINLPEEEIESELINMRNAIDKSLKFMDILRTKYKNDGDKKYMKIRLKDLIDDVVKTVMLYFSDIEVKIEIDLDNFNIETLPSFARKVISNVVRNSFEAYRRNREKLHQEFMLRFFKKNLENGTQITIRDNAGGISTRQLERLFEPGIGDGSGMGLFVTKGLAKDLMWDVDLENNSLNGADFIIKIKD
ncbi:MAG: HAMP domain-containing sensor histidine kinase [Candidatus Aminicenantes bacterium]